MRHSEPQYAEITPALEERLRKFREQREAAGDPITKNVGTQVLYEDDDVRVWEMTLEPGEWTDLHQHDHEYILVIDSGDLVAGVMPSNSGMPMDWFVGVVPPGGNTVRVPKGGIEWAYNVGEQTYHEVLIELKKT